jgi:hypothetical protein
MVNYQKTEEAFKAANLSDYAHDGNFLIYQEEKRWLEKVESNNWQVYSVQGSGSDL